MSDAGDDQASAKFLSASFNISELFKPPGLVTSECEDSFRDGEGGGRGGRGEGGVRPVLTTAVAYVGGVGQAVLCGKTEHPSRACMLLSVLNQFRIFFIIRQTVKHSAVVTLGSPLHENRGAGRLFAATVARLERRKEVFRVVSFWVCDSNCCPERSFAKVTERRPRALHVVASRLLVSPRSAGAVAAALALRWVVVERELGHFVYSRTL